MSPGSNASSSIVESGGAYARPSDARLMFVLAVLKYVLLVLALTIPYVSAFLTYPLPAVSDRLLELMLLCWFFIFFYSLCTLVLRRWKSVALYALAWAWLFFGNPAATTPFHWFVAQGFRIHASPVAEYLARCRMVEFIENGLKQTVGYCQGADKGPYIRSVYYDTTGELALLPSERTPEWKSAVLRFSPNKTFINSDPRARHLFGGFYELAILLEEFDGDDGR